MGFNMEKYSDIIGEIKNLQPVKPPDGLVSEVMEGIKKTEDRLVHKFYRLLFKRRELSSDAADLLSGKIVSHNQCFFLLFIMGLFYLIMGLFVIFGMQDILRNTNINLWLRLQPYLAIIAGCSIMMIAFFVLKKNQMILFAKYLIIAHSIFIIFNALILEFIIIFPVALAFMLALSALAVLLNILLVSSIHNLVTEDPLVISGGRFAQDI